jgi:hypothetical protein
MKKTTALILTSLLSLSLNAQQISLEYGKVISRFDYKNSKGERLDNMQGSTDNHVAIGFNLPVSKADLYILSGIALNKYGAQCSDEILGNYYEWKLNYLDVNVGVGYEFLKSNSQLNLKNTNSESSFTFYAQICTGAEFLLQGNQTINNQVYNLKGAEQFNKPLIFVQGGIGAKYYASKSISVFVQYMGGKSFSLFKSDSGDHEKLNFITHCISLGIGIILPSRK